jgi:phosphoribosylformimino-5-aminoimidazole carboxamide ribotide isomerase
MNNPTNEFIIFPAIDLRGGQVVRLKEGDPNRQTHYSPDPALVARRWISAGAAWLHVVNLDGAFDQPDLANRRALEAILAAAAGSGVKVQFGGGLRSIEAVDAALEAGVERVMLGTLAVEQPEVLERTLQRWGSNRAGASLDARAGLVQVRGWLNATSVSANALAQSLAERGLRWLVFTDIARDGLQTGLNLPATIHLARTSSLNVIASGGVSTMTDVESARAAGLAGVIVGRALYEGAIDPLVLFQSV